VSSVPMVEVAWYGSAPPSSPYDGQEWIYPVDVANSVVWRLRYDLANTRWVFIGGAPLGQAVWGGVTSNPTVANTPWPLADWPQLTIPRQGVYLIDASYNVGDQSGTQPSVSQYLMVFFNGTSAGYQCSISMFTPWYQGMLRLPLLLNIAAGSVLALRAQTNVAGKNLMADCRQLFATPRYIT